MSNIAAEPNVQVCAGRPEAGPVRELLPARAVPLGESTVVRRLLPTMGRRMVGAWCFVDHYGPDDVARAPGMQVPPHPNTGLQTVSWLLDGEVHHRDSLGSDLVIRPGELGLMTAGAAIAHSEQSPDPHSPVLHGAQLWVALPDAQRHRAPSFAHHAELPVLTDGGLRATLLLGELAGARSPGLVHTALVGVDVVLVRRRTMALRVRERHPQLGAVQDRRVRVRRLLGVRDGRPRPSSTPAPRDGPGRRCRGCRGGAPRRRAAS